MAFQTVSCQLGVWSLLHQFLQGGFPGPLGFILDMVQTAMGVQLFEWHLSCRLRFWSEAACCIAYTQVLYRLHGMVESKGAVVKLWKVTHANC